jgi:hypothetical protein
LSIEEDCRRKDEEVDYIKRGLKKNDEKRRGSSRELKTKGREASIFI